MNKAKTLSLKKEIEEKIRVFLRDRQEIIFAYIFGSFSKSDAFNDIDLAIYIDNHKLLKDDATFYEVELSIDMEKIIKIPVDVVILNKASPQIVSIASRGVLVKDEDEGIRVDFITLNWKKYWELQAKVKEHIQALKDEN